MQGDRAAADQHSVRVVARCALDGAADIVRSAHVEQLGHQLHRRGDRVRDSPLPHDGRVPHVEQHRDSLGCRNRFLEELDTLTARLHDRRAHAGDVAARVGKAADSPGVDRVTAGRHDDRYRLRPPLGGQDGGRAGGEDDIDRDANELRRDRGKSIRLSFRRSVLEDELPLLDIPELFEAPPERGELCGIRARRPCLHDADAIPPRFRLRGTGRARRRRACRGQPATDPPEERSPGQHVISTVATGCDRSQAVVNRSYAASEFLRSWLRRITRAREVRGAEGYRSRCPTRGLPACTVYGRAGCVMFGRFSLLIARLID